MKFKTIILIQFTGLNRVIIYNIKSSSSIPTSFKQLHNYPNPFNPMTTLKLDIPPISNNPPARSGGKGVFIKLVIYNITGKEASVLIYEEQSSGICPFNGVHLTIHQDCISSS